MFVPFVLLSLLTSPRPAQGATTAPLTRAAAVQADASKKTDADRARAAFARLKPAERKDIADFLELELEHLPTFQMTLERWVLAQQDRDRLQWPDEAEIPFFDPERHAPAQPIPRHRLEATDARATAVRKALHIPVDVRAWAYDWASGSIVHRRGSDTPERAFELALSGRPPHLDLVAALVERALDDGSQRKVQAAFAHAYTDRTGLVYPGITLYDAWKSGAELEMPDVDCLGLVHTLYDDWTTWTSIVAAERQDSLYERIAQGFQPAQRQRELRVALASTFLDANPKLCCGYEVSIDNFHALWDTCASTPAELAQKLPGAAGWKAFLEGWVAECLRDGEMFQRGVARRATLAAESGQITATLMRVLEEYGALTAPGETTSPAPKPKPTEPRTAQTRSPSDHGQRPREEDDS